MPLLHDRLAAASTLVDVREVVPRGIDGTRIGAGTTLAELEASGKARPEEVDFLKWLHEQHFVFLGARIYEYPRLKSGEYAAAQADAEKAIRLVPGDTTIHEVRALSQFAQKKYQDAPGTLYDKDGNFLLPCTIRDLSRSGGRLELFKDAALPRYFYLSTMPDGSVRRLCSKVWQLALIAGVRFVEKQAA